MDKQNSLKVAVLAASIALAMVSTAAAAVTAPVAGQLPGKGNVVTGTVTAGLVANGQETMTIGSGNGGNAVIDWGSGTDLNPAAIGGFNIGSAAALTFANGNGGNAAAVLNIDSSGNPSQIFGSLGASDPNTSIFVANANGIIVGGGGTISATAGVGLIANQLSAGDGGGFAGPGSLSYEGSGGDVNVRSGASVSGGTVLITGGRNVNVDVSALTGASGSTSLRAGVPSSASQPNRNAAINVSGDQPYNVLLGGFESAGNASNSGKLVMSDYSVYGWLTNTGFLTLPADNGKVKNEYIIVTIGTTNFRALTNNDGYDARSNGNAPAVINVDNGDFANNGNVFNTMGRIGSINVINGNLLNNGTIAGVSALSTGSSGTGSGDYSIINDGYITSNGDLSIDANTLARAGTGLSNQSTGSFTNAGSISLQYGFVGIDIKARNDITLAGKLQTGSQLYSGADVSESNPWGALSLAAGGYDASSPNPVFATDGVLTVLAPVFANDVSLYGSQVKVLNNVTSLDGSGNVGGTVDVVAGPTLGSSGYALRVAAGKTISAGTIAVSGSSSQLQPNVIMQGTLAANSLVLGTATNPINDLFSGPDGGLMATGQASSVSIAFTGRVKVAPYLNANNFRYNFLTIGSEHNGPVSLTLNPVAYATNGTSNGLSAVNVLVDGDVTLNPTGIEASAIFGTGSAGDAISIPNTHLVIQGTGGIATVGDYYWPGFVYLGTIASNSGGSVAPGTLGAGRIETGGNFSNVLPGSAAIAGGIKLMTKNLLLGGSITTNANSWISFGTTTLTQAAVSGELGEFFGGTLDANGIVNYGPLDPLLFQTQAPVATK